MQGRRLQSKVEGVKERDTSPGRSKRDGKPATERQSLGNTSTLPDVTTQDQKRRRRLQDPLPLEVPLEETISKPRSGVIRKGSDLKVHELTGGLEQSSNPTHVPHAGSYFQHDERSVALGGRNIKRRAYDRGDWNDNTKGRNDDTKVRPSDRYRDRAVLADVHGREDRGQVMAREDGPDKVWRHDRFFELEAAEPQERRKPPFREKKIISHVESTGNRTATESIKHTGFDKVSDSIKRTGSLHEVERWSQSDPGTGRRERERDHVQRKEDVGRGRWLEKDPQIEWSRYRGRVSGASRGRELLGRRFDGSERNQFRARNFSGEKWKHDLFDENNRSPTPKNEEDQIAKIESLLAG